jgi:16S rRNA (cytosine1402-N4)-methyltransferase
MAEEVVHLLQPRPGGRYVDGTLGDGGHAERLLDAHPTVEVLGVDRDSLTIASTGRRLAGFAPRFRTYCGSFSDLDAALAAVGWPAVDGILLDLGVSSRQLDDPERGFGFRAAGPLDMRMSQESGPSAADLVATLDETELAELFRAYGEEPAARRIARAIVARRARAAIATTSDLADLVASVVPRRGKQHPATRVFQALRIAVNRELEYLDRFLARALDWLAPGGRLAIISYHSLEDRRVKRAFQSWAGACECPALVPRCQCGAQARVTILTRKAVTPSAAEVARNRRARSARLRAVEMLAPTAGRKVGS